MRGKITGKAVKPMDQEYTVSITLPLSDWKEFRDGVIKSPGNSSYPQWQIISAISEVINHAEDHFTKSISDE